MSCTLLIAAHGSHLDGQSSLPVYAHADAIRATGAFDEVRVAFWKEEPALSRAFDGCVCGEVTVVPFFMATGYFTEQVIPREMGLTGPVTYSDGRSIRYAKPVGTHPGLAALLALRADEAGADASSAVVVLGHGTPRNPSSARTVYERVEQLRALNRYAEVAAAFIDQEPGVTGVFELVAAQTVVVAPLFVAEGWHVGQTIPADLALDGAETRRNGRILRYAAPVGTHPRVADIILDLASEAAAL